MTNNIPTFAELINIQLHYFHLEQEIWMKEHVFSYQWWFLVLLTIIPWIFWWKIVDKKRVPEIISFGIIISMLSANMDMMGISFQAWHYPIKLHWTFSTPTAPFDISLLPVIYMICYQYGNNWKSFIIGVLLISLFFTLGEYVFKFMGIYKENTWKSIYSLPIYSLNAMFARWLIRRLSFIQKGLKKSA